MAPYFEGSVHSLKGTQYVSDTRHSGLAAGITVEAVPRARPYQIAMKCWKK